MKLNSSPDSVAPRLNKRSPPPLKNGVPIEIERVEISLSERQAATPPARKTGFGTRLALLLGAVAALLGLGRRGAATEIAPKPRPVETSLVVERDADTSFALEVEAEQVTIRCTGFTAEERDDCIRAVEAAVDTKALSHDEEASEGGLTALIFKLGGITIGALIPLIGVIYTVRTNRRIREMELAAKDNAQSATSSQPERDVTTNIIVNGDVYTFEACGEAEIEDMPENIRLHADWIGFGNKDPRM